MSNPYFYRTGDATKTPVDPYTLTPGTSVTLVGASNRHPEREIVTIIPRPWPPGPNAFVYLAGDVTKTPVDLSAQAVGTDLILVSGGKETPVTAGNFTLKPAQNVDLYVKVLKAMMNSNSNGKPSDPNSF